MERHVTRSTSNTRRDPEETEGAHWGRVIDPSTIERGQAEAIRTVRCATSGDPTALLNTTQNEQEVEGQCHGQPASDNHRGSLLMCNVVSFKPSAVKKSESNILINE